MFFGIKEFESSVNQCFLKNASYMIQSNINLTDKLKITAQNTHKRLTESDPKRGTFQIPDCPKKTVDQLIFKPCGIWRDKDEFSTDEYSTIYLHNILIQLKENLKSCTHRIELALRGIEGSTNLLDIYIKNPLQGNPEDIKDSILEQKCQLHLITREQKRNEIQIKLIVENIGGIL
jgi:hypothetical protein